MWASRAHAPPSSPSPSACPVLCGRPSVCAQSSQRSSPPPMKAAPSTSHSLHRGLPTDAIQPLQGHSIHRSRSSSAPLSLSPALSPTPALALSRSTASAPSKSLTTAGCLPPSISVPRRHFGDVNSLWHIFTSATVFGGISAALTQAIWGYLRMRNENKPREIMTYVRNILRALNERFVPPQQLRWGPVFSNPPWRSFAEALLQKVVPGIGHRRLVRPTLESIVIGSCSYHVYYGSSQTGKSLAISHALSGYTGVTYLSLRGIPDEEVWAEFAHAINFHGYRTGADAPGAMLMRSYGEACEKWKSRNPGKKPILIVEDLAGLLKGIAIGPQMAAFSARLIRLHQKGTINVVYTISNYPSVTALRTVSGHARIGAEHFPPIPDQVLIEQIAQFAEPFKDSAALIVQTLGSHLSDVTYVLRAVQERGKQVEEALDAVVRANMDQLRLSLLGDPQILGQETFVLAAHHLVRMLTAPDAPEKGVRWGAVQDSYPSVDTGMLFVAIKQLVEICVFTFIDAATVQLYSRSLRNGYVKYLANDPDVLRVEGNITKYFSATNMEKERQESHRRRKQMLHALKSASHARRVTDMTAHVVEAPPPNVRAVSGVLDDGHHST